MADQGLFKRTVKSSMVKEKNSREIITPSTPTVEDEANNNSNYAFRCMFASYAISQQTTNTVVSHKLNMKKFLGQHQHNIICIVRVISITNIMLVRFHITEL